MCVCDQYVPTTVQGGEAVVCEGGRQRSVETLPLCTQIDVDKARWRMFPDVC